MIYLPSDNLGSGTFIVSVAENSPWYGSITLLASEADITNALQQAGYSVVSVRRSVLTYQVDITLVISCCSGVLTAADLLAQVTSFLNSQFTFTSFQGLQVATPGSGKNCCGGPGKDISTTVKYAAIAVVALTIAYVFHQV